MKEEVLPILFLSLLMSGSRKSRYLLIELASKLEGTLDHVNDNITGVHNITNNQGRHLYFFFIKEEKRIIC